MPKNSAAPPLAKRKPVLTSSKIRRIPYSWVRARIAWWKPGLGMIPWALPRTGSTMIAAISSPRASNSFRRRVDVVVAGRDDRLGDRTRDAAAPGEADRRIRIAQLGHVVRPDADERVVVDAVVLAFELHDLVAAGVGTGDAHRVHGGLGAGHGHADLVHPAGQLLDQLHGADLVLAGQREADAAAHPLVDVVVDALVAVAEDDRAVAHPQVHEPVAVEVPDLATLAAIDVDRVLAPRAEVRVGHRRAASSTRGGTSRTGGNGRSRAPVGLEGSVAMLVLGLGGWVGSVRGTRVSQSGTRAGPSCHTARRRRQRESHRLRATTGSNPVPRCTSR